MMYTQEKGTYQADNIYKSNNVKLRKWYSGTNKKLGAITYYDKEGRLIKYQVFMNMGATTRTTYYQYDLNGRLTKQVDSTINGDPDKKEIKKLKKMGLNPAFIIGSIKDKPPLEISKYEISYDSDFIKVIVKYNPDGSLDYVDSLMQNGQNQVRHWYRDNKLYQISTTEYLTPFLKEKYYGWEIRNSQKGEWNYTFEYTFENGQIKSYVSYDNKEPKETVKYYYDSNGLLVKTEGYVLELFEYEHYE